MAIGIKYPIRLGKIGYFEQSNTTVEEVRGNIINLLLTNRGERYMQPEFGTDIYKILFENISNDLPDIIEQQILNSVEIWLPQVILRNVQVSADPKLIDQNRIEILVEYSVLQDPNTFETINLEFNF